MRFLRYELIELVRIVWISAGVATLPASFTVPSMARAGVAITPNRMMSWMSVT